MPILLSEIMKMIDERKRKKKQRKKERDDGSYGESVRAKWFCYAFKLSFLQIMCKASLIFKSNLKLTLSIILKEREL